MIHADSSVPSVSPNRPQRSPGPVCDGRRLTKSLGRVTGVGHRSGEGDGSEEGAAT